MTPEQIAKALNEWMRRYIDDPNAFDAEFETVGQFLKDENEGKEPSYGENGAAYMKKLLEELQAAA
jgi:hypothetical protein